MRTIGLILILFLASLVGAQSVPSAVNYQGRLVDSNGDPLQGTKKLEFNIYDAATGGSLLWGPQVFDNVSLIDGSFNVILSQDTQNRPVDQAFQGATAYLGIKSGDAGGSVGAEFLPRQQFLAVPYAFRSLDSESANVDELLDRIEALENAVFPRGSVLWAKRYELGTNGRSGGVAFDEDGNVILGGVKGAISVDFGDGPLDSTNGAAFLVKYDRDGNTLWSQQWEGTEVTQYPSIFAVDTDSAGNIYIAGQGEDSVAFGNETLVDGLMVAKLSPDGDVLWVENYPEGSATRIKVAPDGSVVVSGLFNGNSFSIGNDFLEPTGRDDIFLAKFSGSDGAPMWARDFGSVQDDEITGIDISPTGDIVVAGQYESSMNIGAISLSHHGIVSNSYYYRLFFARFNSSGTPVWANGYAPSSARHTKPDASGGIGFDSDGNIWSSAHFVGGRDFGGGAIGVDNIDQVAFLELDANGDYVSHANWQAFEREQMLLAMVGDNPVMSFVLSSSSPINFGGSALGVGHAIVAFDQTTTGFEHRWSVSYPLSGLGVNDEEGSMDANGSRIAVVRDGNADYGSGFQDGGDLYLVIVKH